MKNLKILFLLLSTILITAKAQAAASCKATLYTDRGGYLTSINRRGYNINEACTSAYRECLNIRRQRLDNYMYDFDRYYYSSCQTDVNWTVPNQWRLVRQPRTFWYTRRGNGYRPRTDDHRGTRVRDNRRGRNDRRGDRNSRGRGGRRGRH